MPAQADSLRCVALYDHEAKVQQGFNLVGFRKGMTFLFRSSYQPLPPTLSLVIYMPLRCELFLC